MGSKGIKQLGGDGDFELFHFILTFAIFAGILGIVLLLSYLFPSLSLEQNSPIAGWKIGIHIVRKKVEEKYVTTHTDKVINGEHVMVPENKVETRYYIEGTDRHTYSMPKKFFDKVKYNDVIQVIIVEDNDEPGIYKVDKFIGFYKRYGDV